MKRQKKTLWKRFSDLDDTLSAKSKVLYGVLVFYLLIMVFVAVSGFARIDHLERELHDVHFSDYYVNVGCSDNEDGKYCTVWYRGYPDMLCEGLSDKRCAQALLKKEYGIECNLIDQDNSLFTYDCGSLGFLKEMRAVRTNDISRPFDVRQTDSDWDYLEFVVGFTDGSETEQASRMKFSRQPCSIEKSREISVVNGVKVGKYPDLFDAENNRTYYFCTESNALFTINEADDSMQMTRYFSDLVGRKEQ